MDSTRAGRRYGTTGFHHMVDMARTSAEQAEEVAEIERPMAPEYPYGLCIALTEAELEKLGLDDSCDIGDTIHFIAMARVTGVSKREDGCRIELQIEQMDAENEDEEAQEAMA